MLLDIPLEQIDEGYARLRLTNPKAETNLLSSIKKYGQVSPVIVSKISSHRYEMVDGFKRLRVCRKLNFETLQAKTLGTGSRSLKATMIFMNWEIRSITDLEEGMVITSLHREDDLSQTVIATLLGRHKSWVCRRIALIERLSDEVLSHIKLGLINPTIGRELSKLPRGNQQALLQTVLKHRLSTRHTANLVSMLQKEPEYNPEAFLDGLNQACLEKKDGSNAKKANNNHLQSKSNRIDICFERLTAIERLCHLLLQELDGVQISWMTREEQSRICSTITTITQSFTNVRSKFIPTIDSKTKIESNTV
jgi:ParB/RepB/Spo0J family partition protein